jgi:addiction module RelE/StbE family toxin
MQIRRTTKFDNQYKKLHYCAKSKVDAIIELFIIDPFNKTMNNHELSRNLTGCRAISVDNDLRIVFREKGNYAEVLLISVGTHIEVY